MIDSLFCFILGLYYENAEPFWKKKELVRNDYGIKSDQRFWQDAHWYSFNYGNKTTAIHWRSISFTIMYRSINQAKAPATYLMVYLIFNRNDHPKPINQSSFTENELEIYGKGIYDVCKLVSIATTKYVRNEFIPMQIFSLLKFHFPSKKKCCRDGLFIAPTEYWMLDEILDTRCWCRLIRIHLGSYSEWDF